MDSTVRVDGFVKSIYKTIYAKCLKPIKMLDKLITQNLRDSRINTRPASNGLWCLVLLPTVLTLYSLLYEVPQAYKLAACVSLGLFFYGILFYVFMSISCQVMMEGLRGGSLVSGMITSTLIYIIVKQDILFVAFSGLPSAFIFSTVLRRLLAFPNTFTIGEAMIVAQSIAILIIVMVAKATWNLDDASTEVDLVNAVVFTVLSTVGLIVTALCLLKEGARTVNTLKYIVVIAAGLALLQIHVALGYDSIPKIIKFLVMDQTRVALISFWAMLVLLAIAVLVWRTRRAEKATTVTRKSFHVLAAAVFATGILFDQRLMELAAGIGLGLLIFVETLRKSGIEPISSALQSAFLVYCDEKDCGEFALTPIYMYCGLGAGLLARGAGLERLAGVLAVGVGDAAASWGGARLGRHRWPGQSRTVEGTLFNILSQILAVYCLVLFGLMDSKNAVLRTTVAATATSLVEANTDQVDNLILPLVSLIAFQTTYFIS